MVGRAHRLGVEPDESLVDTRGRHLQRARGADAVAEVDRRHVPPRQRDEFGRTGAGEVEPGARVVGRRRPGDRTIHKAQWRRRRPRRPRPSGVRSRSCRRSAGCAPVRRAASASAVAASRAAPGGVTTRMWLAVPTRASRSGDDLEPGGLDEARGACRPAGQRRDDAGTAVAQRPSERRSPCDRRRRARRKRTAPQLEAPSSHVHPGYQACTLIVVSGPRGAAVTCLARLVARGFQVAVPRSSAELV